MQNDVVKNAIDSLLIAKSSLESQLKSVNHAISSLKGENDIKSHSGLVNSEKDTNSSIFDSSDSEYKTDWSLRGKFQYLLKREQRFLHFREVADLIVKIDGSGKVGEIVAGLSSATIALKKSGQIVKYQPTNRNRETFWGISKWFDESGKVKPENEINEQYLLSSSKDPKIDFDI
jgi:hypothetical protein